MKSPPLPPPLLHSGRSKVSKFYLPHTQRIQKKDFKETRENKWATAPASWEPAELNNADFEEYYKQQVLPICTRVLQTPSH